MPNYGIIEREACVLTIWMCLAAAAAMQAEPNQSHQLQELLHAVLAEIMKEVLTTMFLPCAFRVGHLYNRTFFRIWQLALVPFEHYLQFIYTPAKFQMTVQNGHAIIYMGESLYLQLSGEVHTLCDLRLSWAAKGTTNSL